MKDIFIKISLFCVTIAVIVQSNAYAQKNFVTDIISTKKGNIEITFIGHGSLMLKYSNTIIHVDPFSQAGDYSKFPKADIVLITHHHGDHLDTAALSKITALNTKLILTAKCKEMLPGKENLTVLANGESVEMNEIKITAVPAYNIVNKRDNGAVFHPKGEGNGYIITCGGKNIYIAGDTENTPEMKSLKNIDIAFLPMNLPYTMTPEMVADAAKSFKPSILYPYHTGNTDVNKLVELMKDTKGVDVRIREMK
ncbi:MAG: MBL fold metallo-hydrolase [Bacteroidales bacterium]